MSPDPESYEYDPRLFHTPLGIAQVSEPNIVFYTGSPFVEVMRIDKNGVKVNPEYTVDEATQHVLNALTEHIQHTVSHAVAQEREACAKVCEDDCGNGALNLADAIRARSSND